MEVAFSSFTGLRRGCILYGGAPVLVMHLRCKMHLFPCEERCNRSIRMQVIRLHWLPGSHCIYAASAFLAFVTLCTRSRPNAHVLCALCNSSSLGIVLQRVIPSCSILGSSAFEGRGAAHNVYFLDEITTEDPLWLPWVSLRAIRTLWSNVNSEHRHLSFIAEHCEHYYNLNIMKWCVFCAAEALVIHCRWWRGCTPEKAPDCVIE